jgi:hypothetical protein
MEQARGARSTGYGHVLEKCRPHSPSGGGDRWDGMSGNEDSLNNEAGRENICMPTLGSVENDRFTSIMEETGLELDWIRLRGRNPGR